MTIEIISPYSTLRTTLVRACELRYCEYMYIVFVFAFVVFVVVVVVVVVVVERGVLCVMRVNAGTIDYVRINVRMY